jgi:hypothetical protein
VPVLNFSPASDQTGECFLSTALPPPNFPNSGHSQLRLFGGPGDIAGAQAQIPLIGTATFTIVSTITVSCTGFNWHAFRPAIVAIKVGTLSLSGP